MVVRKVVGKLEGKNAGAKASRGVSIGNMHFGKTDEGKSGVVVYSTSTCPYCTMAKDYLKRLGIGFEEKHVDLDAHALEEMLEKSGQTGVPVLDIGGTVIVGFDRPEIDAALRLT